jgi:hypothetical protein
MRFLTVLIFTFLVTPAFAGQTIMSTSVVLVPSTSRLHCIFTNVSNKPITLTTFVIDQQDNILARSDFTVPVNQSVNFEDENLAFVRCAFDFTPGSAKSVRASALVEDIASGNPLISVPAQ